MQRHNETSVTYGVLRRAEATDAAWVDVLTQRLSDDVLNRRGGREFLRDLSQESDGLSDVCGVIAEWESVPVGYVRCGVSKADGRLGLVPLLYVEEGFRRLGLGTDLLEAAKQELREMGCNSIEIIALPGDSAFKNLLESFGFKSRALIMSTSLV